MNWNDVQTFLLLVQHGSARATAAAMSVSHSTVSRNIDQLESVLAVRLFDRHVGGYKLTSLGEALLPFALQCQELMTNAELKLRGGDTLLEGDIRFTAASHLVTHLLVPDLAEFERLQPKIELKVLLSYESYNLHRGEADVALRFLKKGRQPPESLVGRKLLSACSAYYATSKYLEEHAYNASALSFACDKTRWLGWGDQSSFPEWVVNSPFPDVPCRGNYNDLSLQFEAARAHMGLAVLPCFLADSCADLLRIPATNAYESYDLWLLSHPELRDTARFRVFRQFLVEAIDRHKSVLIGCV
ncbi:LysR family transcriptional regulator [Agaribacterium sp. ZY112]|uniref:LysR family transcriptional regulator n=1 Tax=Agaribacterium sp. ZY112 TaxID=3233574 RepID=UPI0035256625